MISDSIFTIHRHKIEVPTLNTTYYLIPFGDIHRFSPLCDTKKWYEFLDWAKSKENTYFIGMGDYCLPLDTEILTKKGFRRYYELNNGEEVLGYNNKTNHTEWTKLLGIYFSYNQPLLQLSSKSFNFRCTPNHTWFIRKKEKEFPQRISVKNFKTYHRIITFASCVDNGYLNITPKEAELLGWIVTDGHCRKNKLAVSISQSIGKFSNYLESNFMGWFTNIYKGNNGCNTFNIKTSKIRELFNRIGYKNKDNLIRIVLNMSLECRLSMLKAFNMAEGWIQNGNWCFSQLKESPVLEAYQLLCILTGTKISKPILSKHGIVTFKQNKRQCVDIYDLKISPIGKENVFCPQTELGSIVIRQNGQVAITGNCDFMSFSERKVMVQELLHESSYAILDDMMTGQVNKMAEEIGFMKGKLIGLIEGNHHGVLQTGITTTQLLCDRLQCKFLGISSFIALAFEYQGKRAVIDMWLHHGRGASRLVGSSLNTVQQMSDIADADIYLLGHDHKKSLAMKTRLVLKHQGTCLRLSHKKILLGRTGSFLMGYVPDSPSYVTKFALSPTDLGTLKIELTPKRYRKDNEDLFYIDIHASL